MSGLETGNPVLDGFIEAEVPRIVLAGRRHFAGKTPDERLDLAREGVAALMHQARERAPREVGKPIACGDRCSSCCVYSKRIAVLPVELRRILDLVESQGRLEEVQDRAELRRKRGKGACPLLSPDGRCTVYAERPLACRRYHSLDRDACESSESPAVPWIPQVVAAGLALAALAMWTDGHVALFEALPGAVAGRLKQARKRQRRARAA